VALIPEDGSNVPNANGYASVAEVSDYFDMQGGDTAWTAATTPQKEGAIVRATLFIERRWGAAFRGTRTNDDQSLAWPRSGALDNTGRRYPDDAIPRALVYGTAEYAKLALTRPDLFAAATNSDPAAAALLAGAKLSGYRSKVDVLEEEFSFATAGGRSSSRLSTVALASDAAVPEYPAADLWLEELIRGSEGGSGGGVRIGRVSRA